MILIHIPRITNRLGYTLNVLFHNILQAEYSFTTNADEFAKHEGAKFAYGPERICQAPFFKASKLLFQTTIEEQDLSYFEYKGLPALFPVYGKETDLPFDPFAAIFYIITRYEEYLPHLTDPHGRFSATDSVAYQYGFLQIPIVDHWAALIRNVILSQYPSEHIDPKVYEFEQTIDVDAAYCYRHKGLPRTIMGALRDGMVAHDSKLIKQRLQVLRHKERDPFDTFDYILSFKEKHKSMKIIFFVLLGDYSNFDKPISYNNSEFRNLIQHIGDYAKVGIHPSYGSLEHPENIEKETHRLESILHRTIVRSRFHFLRIQMPRSFRSLIHAEILNDYSLGYHDEPGFRAGTCVPFPFYDLESDQETPLMLHPFAVMDTTLQKYKKMDVEQAWNAYKTIIDATRQVGSTFCAIWHNQNLSDSEGWEGWKALYEKVLEYADPQRSNPIEQD